MKFFKSKAKPAAVKPAAEGLILRDDKPLAQGPVMPARPWLRMRRMLLESAGRLPTPLVVIVMLSLALSAGTAIAIKIVTPTHEQKFMPLRLTVDPSKPALDAARLQGLWTATAGDQTLMLRLNGPSYEIIAKPPGNNYNRRFARGNFRVEGDVLIMTTRNDMGKPSSDGLVFMPLSLPSLNARVEENGRLMLWLVPQSERAKLDRDGLSVLSPDAARPLTWVRIN